MKFLLDFLEKHGRKRIVMDRGSTDPYLERYYLFLKDRNLFPFNLFLHKFLKSDPDDVHDHPWPYATLILKGGYYEWIPTFGPDGTKIGEVRHWRGPGHFRFSRATSFHRIELTNVECWTLFMPGPQTRNWGFLVKAGLSDRWVSNSDYLQQKSLRNV